MLKIQMTTMLPNFVDLIEQPSEVTFVDSTRRPDRHHVDRLVVLDDDRKLVVAIKSATKVTAQLHEALAADHDTGNHQVWEVSDSRRCKMQDTLLYL